MPKRKNSEKTVLNSQTDTAQGSLGIASVPKPSYTLGQAVIFVALFQKKDDEGNLSEERYTLLGVISGAILAAKHDAEDTSQKPVLKWFYTIAVEDISDEGNRLYRKFTVLEDNVAAV